MCDIELLTLSFLSLISVCLSFSFPSKEPTFVPLIIGGREAKDNEFPYQIAIREKKLLPGEPSICGGSIISNHLIVTAAHCLTVSAANLKEILKPEELDVVIASRDILNPSRVFEVLEMWVHPKFLKIVNNKFVNFGADVAIIQVKGNLIEKTDTWFSSEVILDTDYNRKLIGVKATASGFGLIKFHPRTFHTKLKTTEVVIESNESCALAYNHNKTFFDDDSGYEICAMKKGEDTSVCHGDSGGPLVINGHSDKPEDRILVGIVSRGMTKCLTEYPGVYIKVSSVIPWIEEVISEVTKKVQDKKSNLKVGWIIGGIFIGVFVSLGVLQGYVWYKYKRT